ncbi:MAG: hypothetical protein NTX56_04055 [Proteobacteria bacterium]|nr:hypothetical protein [Pseudomonadota bacterium]
MDTNLPTCKADGTVVKWYDRQSRNWIVQKLDASGNQIGDAGITGTRAGADVYEAEFRKEIAVNV